MLLWALIIGCGAGPTPEPPAPSHYPGYPALVHAVDAGDLELAQAALGGMTQGDLPEGPGVERIGAALGMMRTASSVEDLGLGVAAVIGGCEACHQQRAAEVGGSGR